MTLLNLSFNICGCVRNCEANLHLVFQNIQRIMSIVHVEKIIVSYDKSSDKSLLELCKIKKSIPQLHVIVNKEELSRHRTENISNARNRIMEYMESMETTVDYFIMLDMDEVCSKPINEEVFRLAVNKYINEHDCVTFNNESYYDFWALSLKPFVYSCWACRNPNRVISMMREYLKHVMSNNEYISCESSFNGFGIYKYSTFREIRYSPHPTVEFINTFRKEIISCKKYRNIDYLISPEIYDCEHRMFHFDAKRKHGASCIILNQHLFPNYDGGEHCINLKY